MHPYRRSRIFALAVLGLICTLPAGCPSNNSNNGGVSQGGRLKPFESQKAWVDYFRAQAAIGSRRGIPRLARYVLNSAAGGSATDALAPAAEGGAANDAAGDGSVFTGTNLQEAGVDESDVMKSDGEFFYIARGRSLRIVRAAPVDQLAEVGKLQFDDYIKEIYLVGDNSALVLGQRSADTPMAYAAIDIWPPYLVNGKAVVYQVDLTDRANPQVVKKVDLDGFFVNSRVTSGRLVAVLSIVPDLSNRSAAQINRLTINEVMPKMEIGGAARDLVPWQDWLYPESPDGYYMTAVVTLDAADIENEVAAVAVLGGAGTVYASTEALYLTDTSYDFNETNRTITTVHKFAFDENGAARYTASGSVAGRPLNQFSLGEYQGNLRIATHIDPTFISPEPVASEDGDSSTSISVAPQPGSNSVYVLGQSDADLVVKGRIEGIAPGEQLYAARFMEARGYLVTFRQIDPLFALDLADPANPRVAGELHVPGFSDYLHLIDATHVLGIGRATATSPWGGTITRGVQLSLFDVSDPANPTAVQQIELGGYGSYTEVSTNHKAFAYLPESGTLAIPATLYPDDYDPYSNQYFAYVPPTTKVVAYHLDPAAGFTELGRLDAAQVSSNWGYGYFGEWTRPALIGDRLYAVNAIGVRSAALSDFATVASLDLADLGDDYDFFPVADAVDVGATDGGEGGSSAGSPGSTGTTQPRR